MSGMPKQFPEAGVVASLKGMLSRAINPTPAHQVSIDDVTFFERFMRERWCPGVLHWEYSQVPERVWQAFESGEIPRW
jgi:hypothetical protein